MFNIVIGIAWQTSLVAFPIYIVIRRFNHAGVAFAIVVVTSLVLKFTWYNHLRKMEAVMPLSAGAPLPVR
jgi:hypothetical protein